MEELSGATPQPRFGLGQRRVKFRKHDAKVGVANEAAFEASARETIQVGQRFTYLDSSSRERRIGYYDRSSGRFTALTAGEGRILTHFVPAQGEAYVLQLPESTYQASAS